MSDNPPTGVWNEVRVSPEGVSISLYSQAPPDAPIVEDELWLTWSELRDLRDNGSSPKSLNLSSDARSALQEASDHFSLIEETQSENLPNVGAYYRDEDAPKWSENDTVYVERVHEDTRANEWVVDGPNEGEILSPEDQRWTDETVADLNPSYPENDPVVEAHYTDDAVNQKTYAFPASRLVDTT